MMLTIEGLPRTTKYKDLKLLVRTQCNISDIILDGLIVDAKGNKTVRIGLSDDRAGSHLIKCLDGFRVAGHVLSVLPVGKNPPSEPSIPSYGNYNESRENYVAQPYNDYGRSVTDQSQPGPWASSSSQWQGNQIQQQNPQSQNKFNYQQQRQMPTSITYVQQAPQASHLQDQRSVYPQNTQRQEQSYGYQQKPVTDPSLTQHQEARSHVLRAVEIVDSHSNTARPQNRYQPGHGYNAADKPVTIMKDNFQGPTQYNLESINPHYQSQNHGQPSPWAQQQKPSPYNEERKLVPTEKRQGMVNLDQSRDYKDSSYSMQRSHLHNVESSHTRRISPSDRRISPPGRRISPSGRRVSPSSRLISPPGRRISPSGRGISPPGRRISPSGRRISPSGRRVSPSGRRMSPGIRMSPSGRRMSPTGRRISPSGRRISPSGRLISTSGRRISPPGRRISPPGRRISPSSRQIMPSSRRISPSGSRMPTTVRRSSPFHRSPAGHRISPPQVLPTAHRMSPGRRVSPRRRSQERRISPGDRRIAGRVSPGRMSPHKHIVPGTRPGDPGRRRDSPQRTSGVRFSPTRHLEKTEKYGPPEIRGPSKQAYEMPQASKQVLYSGGYQENVQYPIAGMRQPEQRISAWQEVKPIFTGNVKKVEGRRETFEPFGAPDRMEKLHHRSRSPMRRSRSPTRRSPTRDHYNRQSRSPSSQRRSWAYEKRRSPTVQEPPPPPVWPGQRDDAYPKKTRENVERIDQEAPPKRMPVWEGRRFTEKEDSRQEVRRVEEERRFSEDKGIRVHKELLLNKTIPSSSRREPSPRLRNFKPAEGFSTLQREPKFNPRDDFDHHDEEIRRQETVYDRKHFIERPDHRESQRSFDRNNKSTEYSQRKEEPYRRHDERRQGYGRHSPNLDDEIEDVRIRALELSKKTEEFKLEKRYASKREYAHGDKFERNKVVSRKDRSVSRERRERERGDEPRYERQHGSERRHDEHMRTSSADNYSKQKEPEWNMEKDAKRIFFQMNPSSKAKRNKAVEELVEKILAKQNFRSEGTLGRRVMEEVKLAVSRIVNDMFGDQDVSFIEIIIKFNAKYTDRDLTKIFEEVMRSFPSVARQLKRPAPEPSPSPPKRRSPEPPVKQDLAITNLQQTIPPKCMKTTFTNRFVPRMSRSVYENEKQIAAKRSIPAVSKKILNENYTKNASAIEIAKQDVTEPKEGVRELDPVTSRVLESHLRDIMIKVWQALPDDAPTEEEKEVTEQFRNQVGDDLRNVLGLNVTKRLLNVHNSLYVKLHFSSRPDQTSLDNLISQFKINALKRLETSSNVFAAKFKNAKDFDRICAHHTFKCGGVKVAATPCYKFTQCPPQLKTNYVVKGGEPDTETNEITKVAIKTVSEKTAKPIIEKENVKTNVAPTIEKTSKPVIEKPVVKINVSTPPVKISKSSTEKQVLITNASAATEKTFKPAAEKQVVKPNVSAATEKTFKPAAEKQVVKPNVSAATEKTFKPAAEKQVVKPNISAPNEKTSRPATGKQVVKTNVSTATAKTIVQLVKAPNPKVEAAKIVLNKKNDVAITEKVPTKVSDAKTTVKQEVKLEKIKIEKVEVKPEVTILKKVNSTNIAPQKNAIQLNKEIIKNKPKTSNTIVKNNPRGAVIKTEPKQSVKMKPKIKIECDEIPDNIDVGDEMNDEEIFHLLSGGIVLDECGSDDEHL